MKQLFIFEKWFHEILTFQETSDVLLNARVDVVQNVAEFSKRSTSNNISQQQKPSLVHRDSDSDIETIEEANNTKVVEGESNLDSLNSDGIPVGEELNESGEAQYLWSSECSGTTQIYSPEEEDHDDDMEIVDKSETKLEASSGIKP